MYNEEFGRLFIKNELYRMTLKICNYSFTSTEWLVFLRNIKHNTICSFKIQLNKFNSYDF